MVPTPECMTTTHLNDQVQDAVRRGRRVANEADILALLIVLNLLRPELFVPRATPPTIHRSRNSS